MRSRVPPRPQFRFLWRLLDDDGDGLLSQEDLRESLRLPAARLGWSDATHTKWSQWAFDHLKVRDAKGRVAPPELRTALRKSATLRTILMAKEPTGGAMARQPSSGAVLGGGTPSDGGRRWLRWIMDE